MIYTFTTIKLEKFLSRSNEIEIYDTNDMIIKKRDAIIFFSKIIITQKFYILLIYQKWFTDNTCISLIGDLDAYKDVGLLTY